MPPKKGDYVIRNMPGNRAKAYTIKSTRGKMATIEDSSGKVAHVKKTILRKGHPAKYRKTKIGFWEFDI